MNHRAFTLLNLMTDSERQEFRRVKGAGKLDGKGRRRRLTEQEELNVLERIRFGIWAFDGRDPAKPGLGYGDNRLEVVPDMANRGGRRAPA